MNEKIKVGLVEDQILFLQGMKAILSLWPNLEVVLEATEGYTVIDKLNASNSLPDVILLDMSLPPLGNLEFGGKEVTLAVNKNFPSIKIIILSAHNEERLIAELIENGANGYLVKDSNANEVYEAIISVHTKGSYINLNTLRAIQNNHSKRLRGLGAESAVSHLTARELEVLALICEQYTTDEIAVKLFISAKTVNTHRINLLEKTGSVNVAGLVLYAVKNGILKI